MERFQELLTEAAQLKESQLKNQRKNYESLPQYLKAGLNYAKKYETLRKQNYIIQMTLSERIKKQGNDCFKKEKYQQALSKYEEALAIFRYIVAKSYDNMKDDDLQYVSYILPEDQNKYKQEYQTHLTALYLNICSCLSKTNRKEDAIHSADQALKVKQTAKAYYRKAQAYLQYINKETADIKLGFYYLNKCYEITKDASIVQEMHKIKKQIDQERDKEKKWFKFMFDKNSQSKNVQEVQSAVVKEPMELKAAPVSDKIKKMELERGDQQEEKEDERLQKTKQKLAKFVNIQLGEDDWLEQYQGEFISKHGSKIYSIIQLYGYKDLLGQYRALLAHSLELKKESDQNVRKRQIFRKYFQWLKSHPIDKIAKYIERYELQTKWIKEERLKSIKNEASSKDTKQSKKQFDLVQQATQQLKVTNSANVGALSNLTNQVKQDQKQIQKSVQENKSVQKMAQQINKLDETKVPQLIENNSEDFKQEHIHSDVNVGEKSSSKIKYLAFIIALVVIVIIKFLL